MTNGLPFTAWRFEPTPAAAAARLAAVSLDHYARDRNFLDGPVTRRMWVASYVVHLRRVHWRVGADWLYGQLLDGDLASNHLSWQWVAGTASAKPYLFNAANVAKYAPAPWHSFGTAVDASYEALDAVARGGAVPAHLPLPQGRVRRPVFLGAPPADLGFTEPDPALVRGRAVRLVHPWSLGELPSGLPADALTIAVVAADDHRRWPWSKRRWRFVGARMAALTPHRWCADAARLRAALDGAASIHGIADPHLPAALRGLTLAAPSRLFRDPCPERRCDSFSQFWVRATERVASIHALLRHAR